ncbi:MAG: hypothetical protein AAFZ15_20860 [Bacteroidota bacterium]
MEIALSKICGPQDIMTPINEKDESARKSFANISAQNFYIPLNQYSKRKLLSYLSKNKKLPLRFYPHIGCREIKQFVPKKIWSEYFKFTIERNPFDKIVSLYYWREGDKRFGNIYEFIRRGGLKGFSSYDIYSIDGFVAVDKIYRFENLSFFCEDITKRLQLRNPLQLPAYKAKSLHRKVRNYSDVLDEKSIELIKIIFAREIQIMNYEY